MHNILFLDTPAKYSFILYQFLFLTTWYNRIGVSSLKEFRTPSKTANAIVIFIFDMAFLPVVKECLGSLKDTSKVLLCCYRDDLPVIQTQLATGKLRVLQFPFVPLDILVAVKDILRAQQDTNV